MSHNVKRIAIVWDFDGTLTPVDSTTMVVEFFKGEDKGSEFWKEIHLLADKSLEKSKDEWQHILASDAPIWMYSLSRLAWSYKYPLNREFFENFIAKTFNLYPNVIEFLIKIKSLTMLDEFKKLNIEIHHFIISAGLKELLEVFFSKEIMTWVFGCRYKIVAFNGQETEPESVPVFCMDETMKTRSLFEIAKGSFQDKDKAVNERIKKDEYWVPFENMIYVGDGPTDIPSLSLVKDRGGVGIVVYDQEKKRRCQNKIKTKYDEKRQTC